MIWYNSSISVVNDCELWIVANILNTKIEKIVVTNASTCRSFATRVSQLKIWYFSLFGTGRNVCRRTFNKCSFITDFAKLAARVQLCRCCTRRKLQHFQTFKFFFPAKSQILSCNNFVANEQYLSHGFILAQIGVTPEFSFRFYWIRRKKCFGPRPQPPITATTAYPSKCSPNPTG